MNKAYVKVRIKLDQFKCVDHTKEVYYHHKQLINGRWYLYNSSNYVIATYGEDEITFPNKTNDAN